jgi:transposase
VLLSQDEARFPMVPSLCRTLGVKGHRPQVGTWDCKDLLYVLGVVNVSTAALHTNTVEAPARKKKGGPSKTRRLQEAFAAHLRHVGRLYPRDKYPRVVLIIDNAPWHRGQPVVEALADNPQLELYRLPSYSPQLNVIERLWKVLRRRATHNRLFETLAELRQALRANISYFQTVRQRIESLIDDCYPMPAKNQTASTGP